MDLVRTSLLNGIAVAVRMATALALNKVMAIYVGPAGYAVIGQFQNLVSMLTSFASGAMTTGVTKYTAEYHDDAERQRRVWRTAGTLTIVLSSIAAVTVVLLREFLAARFLHDPALADVFVWLAGSLVFISLNSALMAIVNGRKETRRYVAASVAGALFALTLSAALIWHWGLRGALIASSVSQGCLLLLTVAACRRAVWFRVRDLCGAMDGAMARDLGRFVLMAMASVVAVPTSQILIRRDITNAFGMEYAGYWDASVKLSNTYLALATTTLSLYLLPRLSELPTMDAVRREVWKSWRLILPPTAAAAATIYALREWLVLLVFTPKFMPMLELLAWQLVGDVIKMASWVVGYVLIARARSFEFIATEIVFTLLLWLLTLAGTRLFGFGGVSMAYAMTYALYLATIYVLVMGVRRSATPPLPIAAREAPKAS